MRKNVEAIEILEYNAKLVFKLILKTDDLFELFCDLNDLSLSKDQLSQEFEKLSGGAKDSIKNIFNKIILTRKELIEEYKKILIKVEHETKKKLPRRYGKEKVLKDIEAQEGRPTNAQLTALELNDLRNVYSILNKRVINDMLSEVPILTDEDHRTIRSTIILLKNKLRPILNN